MLTTLKKMAKSPHVASLLSAKSYYNSNLGSMRRITSDELPILQNLSIKRLILEPGSIHEPHRHANCNELIYCLSGKVLITQLDVGNKFMNFTITAGQMFSSRPERCTILRTLMVRLRSLLLRLDMRCPRTSRFLQVLER
jgi:quercetin dioxygenase-like cupin family protein